MYRYSFPVDRLSGGLFFIDPIFRKPMHRRSDNHAHLGNEGISYAGIGRMAEEKEQQHMGTVYLI